MAEEKLVCFPEEEIIKPREIIIELMDYMVEKGFTDFSGGNMALRVGPKIYSTQRYSANKYRWRLKPDNIIVTDINKNILEGREEKLSRELDLHLGILQNFPEINCTIHGNTFFSPLLVSMGLKPAGVTEVAQYYNIVDIPILPLGIEPLSDLENQTIFGYMKELKAKGEALVVIMPFHGIIVGAKNHDEAFSLFDAVESNSKFILYQESLKTSILVNKVFEKILGKEDLSSLYPPSMVPPLFSSLVTSPAPSTSSASISVTKGKESIPVQEGEIFDFKDPANILTAEDITEALKVGSYKTIRVGKNCKVTDLAELKASESGLEIIKVS